MQSIRGEAFEDRGAFLLGYSGAVVLDRDFHAFAGTGYVEPNFGGAIVLDSVRDRHCDHQPQPGGQSDAGRTVGDGTRANTSTSG